MWKPLENSLSAYWERDGVSAAPSLLPIKSTMRYNRQDYQQTSREKSPDRDQDSDFWTKTI